MNRAERRLTLGVGVLTFFVFLTLAFSGVSGAASLPLDVTPTVFIYLPLVCGPYPCPATSAHSYSSGIAYQFDTDNPVRPAWNHADKNIELRSYSLNTGYTGALELKDYGSDDPTQPPQLATIFSPSRVPPIRAFCQVHHWNWAPSPNPGTRGDPIEDYPATAISLQTTAGEPLRVPTSGYDIGGGMEVLVLFADEDTIALRYTREDSSGAQGYTVHIDNICTDPNLLSLYNWNDRSSGPRYVYPNASYDLPNLPAGKHIGWARNTEIVVVVSDTGAFQPANSCHEWWQIRPDYAGSCPSP